MLCDRIMDLSQFRLFAVLSIFLAGNSAATSWGSNELDRSDGYDLQRGPVFYEAYYPDDQGAPVPDQEPSSINSQTARRYFDQTQVPEKSYQGFEEAQNIAYPKSLRNSEAKLYPESQGPRNPVNIRRSDEAYEVARQLKRFVEGLEQDPNPQTNFDPRNFENSRRNYEGGDSNFHPKNPYQRMDSEKTVSRDNYRPDRKLDEAMNIILSAIKKEALEISKERVKDELSLRDSTEDNVRISRHQRFVESEDSFDRPQQEIRKIHGNSDPNSRQLKSGIQFPETEIQGSDRFLEKRRYPSHDDKANIQTNFGDDYQDVRGSASQMHFARVENIFQPRPQVISYVFSPSRTATISSTDGPAESKSNELNDQTLGRYGNNRVVNEMKRKVEKSDGMGIASIEVSEVPHHKIRHHHGEKPRRIHQRHATAKNKQ